MRPRSSESQKRLEEQGLGLVEGRKGQPGDKRVPLVRVGKVLRLYWEAHFHEKLSQEHAIKLSKNPCRGGLVARGKHRRRPYRRC